MIQALLATDPMTGLAGAPWFSDAAHLSNGGIPSICIGPGSIDQAHQPDEYVERSQMERGAGFMLRLIDELSTGG